MGEYLKNLIQLIFSPAKGWEDVQADMERDFDELRTADIATAPGEAEVSEEAWEERRAMCDYYACFLPIIGICAGSAFVRMLYDGGPDFLGALQRALITFVSLFLGSLVSRYGFQFYMPKLVSRGKPVLRGRLMAMTMYSLTFLGMITLVANIVKVRIALIEFLPFYVIFIIWKGWKYVGVDERHEGIFMIIATAFILGSPYLISFLLHSLV